MSDKKPINKPLILQLNNYVKPPIVESYMDKWVLNGRKNSFFRYIIDRYNGSPTNSAIIDGYVNMIYGQGLDTKDSATNPAGLLAVLQVIKTKDLRKVISDYQKFGSATMQVIYNAGKKVSRVKHVPRELMAPSKMDKNGDIKSYWYCDDWTNTNKNPPEEYAAFGTKKSGTVIYEIKPYTSGKTYFADPDYLPALQYAMLEEEISNFSINHIKNGLSAGFVVNFNNGVPAEEETKDEIERDVKSKTTGSSNAGNVIISFNDNKENAVTVEAFPQNANHEQWQFWTDEARRQIMVAHKVTSPMLFGIKDNTGLGNNADELETAIKILMGTVVKPKQNEILEALQEILMENAITSQLYFKPLLTFEEEETEDDDDAVELSSQCLHEVDGMVDSLIFLGEDEDEEFELVDVLRMEGVPDDLELKLARTFKSSPNKTSEQDNQLFKIRYRYAPTRTSGDSRGFCKKLVSANKVYRKEDIIAAGDKVVNKGFGPNGTDKYNIWLYKGGVNCNHFWERRIYLRRNNKQISVNQARKMILELEPEDRNDVRLPINEKEVAQPASPLNNNWKLN